MMIHFKIYRRNPGLNHGSTLSEVLISLAVMSIGVVSLASIFPISVLRSVQATQLTNAANLRYNAESLLGPVPQLYTIGSSWQPVTNYPVGAIVIPTPFTALRSPPAVYRCTIPGTSGPTEPNWNFADGGTSPLGGGSDGGVKWQTVRLRNYVIDPLGESVDPVTGNPMVESSYRSAGGTDFFGNYGGTPYQSVRAFSGFTTSPSSLAADSVATLPDSWSGQFESRKVTGFTATSCTIGDVPDLNTIPSPLPAGTVNWRAVLFDDIGKVSHVRILTANSGTAPSTTVSWSNSLPSGFVPVRARIEAQSRKYTWMLSVRRGLSGVAYIDVVVFFNRTFSGKDEQLFPGSTTAITDLGSDLKPGVATIDDDGNGTVDDVSEIGWPGSDDPQRNWIVVQYKSSGDRPFVKKGGFVTDIDNLRWYRVVDYKEGGAGVTPAAVLQSAGIATASLNPLAPIDQFAAGYDRAIFLRLESPLTQSGPQQNASGAPQGSLMLMRGIVDVYPLRTHMSWGS